MFTQTSERTFEQPKTATGSLGPGSYNTNRTSLKRSKYNGPAPFLSMSKKKSIFDEEAKKQSYLPPVGQYTEQKVNYIRGQQPFTSHFTSKSTRFHQEINDVPGPGEYFQAIPAIQVAEVRPPQHKRQTLSVEPSIPYQAQKKTQNELYENPRTQWMIDTVGTEAMQNPGCTTYNPYLGKEIGKNAILLQNQYENDAVKVLPSAWAKAPERPDIATNITTTAKTGPGTYNISNFNNNDNQLFDQYKQSNCFTSKVQRFNSQNNEKQPQIGPGSYSVNNTSISTNIQKIKQKTNLKLEMKKRLEEADQIVQQIHPNAQTDNKQKLNQNMRQFYTPHEKAMMETPAVGQYDISKNIDKMLQPTLSIDAQMKIALFSTFAVEKWHQSGASIPGKIISDEPLQERELPFKPEKLGFMELQTDRGIAATLYQANTTDVGPGEYELDQAYKQSTKHKNFSINNSNAFSNGYKRDILYKTADAQKLEQQRISETEKQIQDESGERRQIGGLATQVNYNLAKAPVQNVDLVFGGHVEREYYSDKNLTNNRDLLVPAPNEYNVNKQSSKLDPQLKQTERTYGLYENIDQLPEVLKQDIGPGAERALNVIAERKQAKTIIGPGSYCPDTTLQARLKKSFNINAVGK